MLANTTLEYEACFCLNIYITSQQLPYKIILKVPWPFVFTRGEEEKKVLQDSRQFKCLPICGVSMLVFGGGAGYDSYGDWN